MLAQIEKIKQTLPYQSGLLATASGLAAALLLVVDYLTQPIIAERVQEDQKAMISQVLAGASYANDIIGSQQTVTFKGKDYQFLYAKDATGDVRYYVVQADEEGYSGKIKILVGINGTGLIQGVRVLSHTETPGLGDKIEIAKSDWVLSFNNRSLSNTDTWAVKKDGGDFDQFSGATITPRAVVKGVHNALKALDNELKESEQ